MDPHYTSPRARHGAAGQARLAADRVKILVQCDDVVGTSMAGPGIRCWEISSQLTKAHTVTLATPFEADVSSTEFRLMRRPLRPLPHYYRGYDAVLTPRVLPSLAMAKRRFGFRLIVDLYDPVLLENLGELAARPRSEQADALGRMTRELSLALRAGDHFVCASEIQRDMWIGSLTTAGRISPPAYLEDPTFRRLIDVVPFGVSHRPRVRTGPGLRERFGIAAGDFVLLWGGGIWNWLDPLTLIESVGEVASAHRDTRLVFMGLEHPNARVTEMAMSRRARQLAQDLGLTGRHVFFNDGWIPYEERLNVLLDADVGVSIHGDHIETHFAFRTRNLDYLSAGLPILSTRGDVFADLLETSGAGITVAAYDRAALTDAIKALRDVPLRARMSEASGELRNRYSWSRVVTPLMRMLDASSEIVRPHPARLTQAVAASYGSAVLRRARGLAPTRRD
jgi:glycosyltransferase involved in cell wall biosynthesis